MDAHRAVVVNDLEAGSGGKILLQIIVKVVGLAKDLAKSLSSKLN
jgi:hypothetical protein